jgi:hypothetical protein
MIKCKRILKRLRNMLYVVPANTRSFQDEQVGEENEVLLHPESDNSLRVLNFILTF